jgi:hypothetical protein
MYFSRRLTAVASETSIQDDILDYLNSLPQGRAENVSGNAKQSGRADINACIAGITYKIEVKTEDTAYGRKGATTKQRLYLEKWARAGAVACVVYSVDDVKLMVNKHLFNNVRSMETLLPPAFVDEVSRLKNSIKPSGKGKWYDVENKRWVDISY